MASWRAKVVSAEEAVARVRSGDLVRWSAAPVPTLCATALAARRHELRGVRVLQTATAWPLPWAGDGPGWEEHIAYASDYLTPLVRPCLDAKRGDFAITDYAIGSRVLENGRNDGWTSDVFMAVVSEPDARGQSSMGWGPWHTKALRRAAKLSIAEVTRGLIRTRGDNTIDLDDFDLIVENPEETFRLPDAYGEMSAERREVTDAVGAAVARIVNDGDTVQLGSGTLSARMGAYLTGKKDLGVDAEIMVPSAAALVQCGAATGRYKTFHSGEATAALIVPGADLDFCNDNPKIALYDVEWVNSLPRIATIRNLVAINQAVAIDLTGQIAAESIGPAMYTGPGGQLMWTMGALFAPGGRAIHTLPSTARGGTVSRIVAQLDPGAVVTVPRTFVDFVVTEHGTANLQGLTQRERALALVDLAHPTFREALRSEARRLFWP